MTDRPDSPDPLDDSSPDPLDDSSQDPSQERDFQTRRQGAVYQGAFEAVIAILVAVFCGYWLDGYFDTSPVFLLIGFAIGFASFTVRLIRLGRWVAEDEAGQSSNSQHDASGHEKNGKEEHRNE